MRTTYGKSAAVRLTAVKVFFLLSLLFMGLTACDKSGGRPNYKGPDGFSTPAQQDAARQGLRESQQQTRQVRDSLQR